MGESFFEDAQFQDRLIEFLVHDAEFLKTAAHLVTADDFKRANKHEGMERQVVVRMALDFWARYRQPVGKLLRGELLEICRRSNWQGETKERLLEYGEALAGNGQKRVAPDAILERVRQYKTEHRLALAMEEMTGLIERGELTTDRFLAIARQAVEETGREPGRPVDIFDEKQLENRILRRLLQRQRQRYPVLLIDPIDRLVRIIARKQLGLILAPYGRGKTLLFVWLALAYTLQGLNVLYFTLEDPTEDIEDRFDAAITALPVSRLVDIPDRVREKFKRYKRMLRSKLKVVDGTDGAVTIGAVEQIFEQERNRGFLADAILIDYDDEVRPRERKQERRLEFAEIYRDFRAVLARHNVLGWTASQTGRKTSELKIIGGDKAAEDLSKVRKASLAVSLGQGEWGEESIFFWIAKHRYDVQHVGANLMTDKTRMLFYDQQSTRRKEKEMAQNGGTP